MPAEKPESFTAEEFARAVQESTKSLNQTASHGFPASQQLIDSGMGTFAAPTSADISVLRQLAPEDALYIMPNSTQPLVVGSELTSQQAPTSCMHPEASGMRYTSQSSEPHGGDGGMQPLARLDTFRAFSAVLDSIAGDAEAEQQQQQPVLPHHDSFKKWASMVTDDSAMATENPMLAQLDSFKKWASGIDDDSIPTVEQLGSFKKWASGKFEDSPAPTLQQLDSFKKWAAAVTDHDSPEENLKAGGQLRHSLSFEMMWDMLKFEASGETAPAIEAALQHPASLVKGEPVQAVHGLSPPESTEHRPPQQHHQQDSAPPVLSGSVLSLPENLLQDALQMLDEPMHTAYAHGDEQVVRLSIKMFDRKPNDLTPDMRSQLEQVHSSAVITDSYLQHGCTHLVVDMALPAGSLELMDPSQLAAALSTGPFAGRLPAGHFLSGQGILQALGGAALRLEGGRVSAAAPGTANSLAPVVLGADTSVLFCGLDSGDATLTLFAVHNLSSGDISKLSISVRQGGAYLPASTVDVALLGPALSHGPRAGLVRARLSIPSDSLAEGLLYVELSNQGVLSSPLPLVATADHGVLKELSQLGPAHPLPPASSKGSNALLLTDVGLLLDAVAAKGSARDVAARASSSDADKAAQVARQAKRARAILLTAAEHGWEAVASAALDQAADDCEGGPQEAVARTTALRPAGSAGLLHAAVRCRNPVLLSMLLDWAGPLDVMEPRGGGVPSPLHLSAALDDGGVVAELLLQHAAPGNPKAQYALWADPNGRSLSPEDVARRCSRQSTVSRMSMKRTLEEGALQQRQHTASLPPLAPQMSLERPPSATLQGFGKGRCSREGGDGLLAKARKLWSATHRRIKGKDKQAEDGAEAEPRYLAKLDSAKEYTQQDGSPAAIAASSSRNGNPTTIEEDEPMEPARHESFLAPLPVMPRKASKGPTMPRTDSARDEGEAAPPGKEGAPAVRLATPHTPIPAKQGAQEAPANSRTSAQLHLGSAQ